MKTFVHVCTSNSQKMREICEQHPDWLPFGQDTHGAEIDLVEIQSNSSDEVMKYKLEYLSQHYSLYKDNPEEKHFYIVEDTSLYAFKLDGQPGTNTKNFWWNNTDFSPKYTSNKDVARAFARKCGGDYAVLRTTIGILHFVSMEMKSTLVHFDQKAYVVSVEEFDKKAVNLSEKDCSNYDCVVTANRPAGEDYQLFCENLSQKTFRKGAVKMAAEKIN